MGQVKRSIEQIHHFPHGACAVLLDQLFDCGYGLDDVPRVQATGGLPVLLCSYHWSLLRLPTILSFPAASLRLAGPLLTLVSRERRWGHDGKEVLGRIALG